MNIPNIRLLNQQLVAPEFTDVHDLVAYMGMLQAQEYRMMRWAVGIRMKRPSMAAFRSAYNSGRIVRTHLFRCTWQLVAAEDLRWMLKLCADRNKAVINGYTAYQGRTIEEWEYDRANSLIRQALAGRRSTAKTKLVERLAELGLSDTAHAMSIFLRRAELDGIICSGELNGKENTYALIDERIPPEEEPSREEAVVILARKYFRSHSPATLEDLTWWTNLNVGECRAAVDALRNELTEEKYNGTTYYIHKYCRTRGCRRQTLLLPSYDEYLLGYKSRHHVLEDEFRPRAYSNNGLFYPVIVSGGRVVGNWHPKKSAAFFMENDTQDITEQLGNYNKFMRG
ncbi:MAG TPA: winged helix DNA-binding domain-containing protein [Candidatus Prevotella stercoripullorum]|nr:winged helix DNA-binding domain-containing protein [Candidatus Prevotella stercoripullorum]